MADRDDVDALAARASVLGLEVQAKSDEVERAATLLREARERAELPVLENIRIASPCRADWNEMIGDERARHCNTCERQVFDLSELTRAEAEALIVEKAGNLCARYYERPDGTILLADCSIAAGASRRRTLVAVASLVLFGTGAAAKHHHDRMAAETILDLGDLSRGHFANAVHGDAPAVDEETPRARAEHAVLMGAVAFSSTEAFSALINQTTKP